MRPVLGFVDGADTLLVLQVEALVLWVLVRRVLRLILKVRTRTLALLVLLLLKIPRQ